MIRRLFDSLHGRFAVLLVVSLLFCNMAAALLFTREGTAFDKALRLQIDMGRLISLVEVAEHADSDLSRSILEDATTAFTRFSIDDYPFDPDPSYGRGPVVAEVQKHLPSHDVRAFERGRYKGLDEQLMILSVQLQSGPHAGRWLTSVAWPLTGPSIWFNKWTITLPLAISLVSSLVIGLMLLGQIAAPLRRLGQASRAAARGDHSVRMSETGPRELREAASAFNTMQQHISEFSDSRRQLVSAISHDLRTPITSLRIRAEMIEDDRLREPMIRKLDEMTAMTDELLLFGRESAQDAPPQPHVLADLVQDFCLERGVPISGESEAEVSLRRLQIRRALGNLVDNAERYAAQVSVHLSEDSDSVSIEVRDRGPGMDPNLLARATSPFLRGEASRSTETGGMGLGLTIVQSIAIAHGGSFQLRNCQGGGLVATLVLPKVLNAG